MSLISRRKKRPRVAVFFSGAGSTLQCLLDQLDILNIVLTVSSKKNALGRLRCRRQSIVNYTFKFPEDFSKTLELLKIKKIDTIICAGFMKILPADFVEQFNGFGAHQAIVNIHPSLLPSYKGLRSVERAFAEQANLGVTIHNVVAEVDSGTFFKRQKVIDANIIGQMNLSEAFVWLRAGEQQILKSWASAVA